MLLSASVSHYGSKTVDGWRALCRSCPYPLIELAKLQAGGIIDNPHSGGKGEGGWRAEVIIPPHDIVGGDGGSVRVVSALLQACKDARGGEARVITFPELRTLVEGAEIATLPSHHAKKAPGWSTGAVTPPNVATEVSLMDRGLGAGTGVSG